jgi:hypothetical protein
MATRILLPREQVFDANGQVMPGAKLYTYASGTSTLKTTYSDAGLTVANTNPLVADSAGRFGDIFPGVGAYKLVLQDADGVTIWTADPVDGGDAEGTGVANVRDYGAVGDGTTNDAAAFVAAAATGLTVYAPAGTYRLESGFTLSEDGQRLIGDGPGMTELWPIGDFDVVTITGGASGCGVENVYFRCTGQTGGWCISISNALRVHVLRVGSVSTTGFAIVQECNVCTFRDCWASTATGEAVWHLYGTPALRSDGIIFDNCWCSSDTSIDPELRPIGLLWEGHVHTVTIQGMKIIMPSYGVLIRNAGGGTFPAETPSYLMAVDIEVDYPYYEGMRIEAGSGFYVSGSYLANSTSSSGLYIADGVRLGAFANTVIQNNYQHGAHIDGDDFLFAVLIVLGNSRELFGTYDGVHVDANAERITFAGCQSGSAEGVGITQRYGLYVAAGAVGVQWSGSLEGNRLEAWRDDSGGGNDNFGAIATGSARSVIETMLIATTSGHRAKATPTIVGGVITAAVVDDGGQLYDTAPTVTAYDPTGAGSGATLTAVVSGGAVTSVTVGAGGTNYSSSTILYFRSASVPLTLRPYPTTTNAHLRLAGHGTDGRVNFYEGKIRMENLPTSSAGLSSGDVWSDAGTLKVAP